MPTFRLRTVNKHFSFANDVELASFEAARSEALKGALEVGTEEVCNGKEFFGAEITIENDGEVVQRLMVAVGASPLQ